jgi:AcrR family transcriptional regulator
MSVHRLTQQDPAERSAMPALDRRIQRTRSLLHEALGALVREKVYDRITVEEILARANIGRSTFYTHFRGKDDLLSSSICDLLISARSSQQSQSADPRERVIRFSRPFFEHIHSHRRLDKERMGKRGRAILHEHLRQVLAESIMQDIGNGSPRQKARHGQVSRELLAQYLASTFVLVLHWWLDCRNAVSPAQADEVFRALVLPALAELRP